jgi:hypothetical protein
MARKRKIIVYIATSADGYIARPDGDVEWLNRPRVAGDYGMAAFFRSIDTILWGRKTYDIGAEGGPARLLTDALALEPEDIGVERHGSAQVPGAQHWSQGLDLHGIGVSLNSTVDSVSNRSANSTRFQD